MKNKLGSIIVSTALIVVVGILLYMFYLQNDKIERLRLEVDTLENTIDTLDAEKITMQESINTMEEVKNEKNDEIEKLNSEIEKLNENITDIGVIRKILEQNFDYSDGLDNNDEDTSVETISFLDMDDDELVIYESFKKEYNDEMLRALEPFTIMKFYLYSGYMKDYETEFELYAECEEGEMTWTKEEYMNIPDEDLRSDFGLFEETYNVEVAIEDNEAIVKWNSDYDNETEFRYGFRLMKNDGDIWKVCFLPMQ